MPSIQARFVKYLLSWKEQPVFRTPEALHQRLNHARTTSDYKPPDSVRAKFRVEGRESNGFPVFDLTPKSIIDEQPPSATILYLHGGCFIFDITEFHWIFLAQLAEQLHACITVPIYPLGPEHQLSDMYDMLQPVYDDLAAAQTAPAPLWVMGDSAGGTFAITLTQCALEARKPVAARLVLISPCVDVTMTNPQMHVVAATRDPWLALPGFVEALTLFLKNVRRDDPRISAIYGCMAGMPPMLIFAATDDMLYPDTLLFAEKATKNGCRVKVVVGEGLMHVWPVLPLPESKTAKMELVEWLQQNKTP